MIGPKLVAVKKEREIDVDIIWHSPIIASRFRAAIEMPSRLSRCRHGRRWSMPSPLVPGSSAAGLARSPLVFAHRGYTDGPVENTVAAFEAAGRLGADGVELDVRRSADWALVVHHDAEIPGVGPVAARPVGELPAHVPLLVDALAACGSMIVNVEVKHDEGADPDRAVAAAVGAALVEGGWTKQVLVSSFDVASLDVVRHAGLAVGRLLGWQDDVHDALADAADRGYQAIHPFVTTVDEPLVADAHAAGLAVNVWTVNAPGDLVAMAELGVDVVMTDRLVDALRLVRGTGPNGEAAAG
jgi:glycerophosphoryl diester phosphodiesterase